ncbi:MAG: hypothetical protein JWQ35_774 [Bacteriovoracaceae bacterium]|nr:hypothetical protein [Bacteriovoracaceae bacterium]
MNQMTKILGLLSILFVGGELRAKTFELDKDHTNVGFSIRHILTHVQGHFKDFAGGFETDDKGNLVKIDAMVKAASIDTSNKHRDEHLRSEDFFNAKKFSELKFVSDKVKIKPGSTAKVSGQLTIHGVTKPVDFEVEYLGEAAGPGGHLKAGATGKLRINRKDYGLTWNTTLETGGVLVGDDVDIALDVEGNLKDSPKLAEVPAGTAKKVIKKEKK